MKRAGIVLLGLVLSACSAMAQAGEKPTTAAEALALAEVKIEEGTSPQREVQARVGALFVDEKFDVLEVIADEYRSSKARWSYGRWKLESFYYGCLEGRGLIRPRKQPIPYLKRAERWVAAHPDSVTAKIVLARVRYDLASNARGGGWASDVTDEGWAGMKRHLDVALKTLKEAESLSTQDPDLYSQFMRTAKLSGRPSSEIEAYYEKGLNLEPGYPLLYMTRAWTLMPRWGGKPGEVEAFARQAAEDASTVPGTGAYAWILYDYDRMVTTTTFVHRFEWSALHLQESFQDILSVYPDDRWIQNLRARLSGLLGDKEEAQKALAVVGRDFDTTVWPDKWAYGRWKRWAENDAQWPGGTGVHYGVQWDNPGLCRAYLDEGVAIDATDESGFTPLHYAAKVGKAEAAKFLIDEGADVSDGKATMLTPLQTAARYGHANMVSLLIEHGADPDLHAKISGSTPLITATRYGRRAVIEVLLEQPSVEVDAQDKQGRTALFFTSTNGRVRLIKLLLDAGADVNHHTKDGRTPLAGARQYKKKKAAQFLKSHGAAL